MALVLTRQKVSVLDRTKYALAAGLHKDAYVLAASPNPDVVLIGTGSELELVVAAYERLAADGRRAMAVSAPCLELFARQPQSYRDSVLPPGVPRIVVEAASPQSWYRWVGERGAILGLDHFVIPALESLLEERELCRHRRDVERAEEVEENSGRAGFRSGLTGSGGAATAAAWGWLIGQLHGQGRGR